MYGTPVAGQTAGRQMYSYHRTLHIKEKARVTSLSDTTGFSSNFLGFLLSLQQTPKTLFKLLPKTNRLR